MEIPNKGIKSSNFYKMMIKSEFFFTFMTINNQLLWLQLMKINR